MTRDLLFQHFQKSGFDEMQADTLAAIFDEMATKQDLAILRTEFRADLTVLRAEMNAGHEAIRNEVAACLNGIRTEMATMKADLTWRFVALVLFLSTVVSLVGVFAQ